MGPSERTKWVAERARALGFDLCGVVRVEDWPELARLPEWLARGFAGEMRYLHDPRRQSPARVLDGASSIIVCALNYSTDQPYSTDARAAADWNCETRNSKFETRPGSNVSHSPLSPHHSPLGWVSRYAWGDDYHEVLGAKLDALVTAMREHFPEPFDARAYVDTGPVVERVAAKRAGLGWLAKNTCLINEQLGSWLFLGVIVTTLDLEPSLGAAEPPPPDLCGQCTLCIEACPTGAIVEPYVLDARRCISYLTVELRGSIPEEFRPAMDWMVFGCDICQDVCPWNRRAPANVEPRFLPRAVSDRDVGAHPAAPDKKARHTKLETPQSEASGLWRVASQDEARDSKLPTQESFTSSTSAFLPSLEFLASLTEDDFRRIFRSSAIKRTKWRGLVRNACVALGNALRREPRGPVAEHIVALLERLGASGDSILAEHARWALAQRKT